MLGEVEAVCTEGVYRVKWIQSKAFCLWKEYRFSEVASLIMIKPPPLSSSGSTAFCLWGGVPMQRGHLRLLG